MLKQTTIRIEEEALETFKDTAAALGTTATDAIRMFIYAFNRNGGFPDGMSMNLSHIPPSFRKKLTAEELVQRLEEAESGETCTHEEVFSRAYAIIDSARKSRKEVA